MTPDPTNPAHVTLARAGPMGWAWMCSGGTYTRPPHVLSIHRQAAEVIRDGGGLLLEMPPRHGKTEAVRYIVGWYMGTYPGRHVIYASNTQRLSDRFGRFVRDDLSHYGSVVFGQSLDASTQAKSDWALSGGGEFFGVGVGGMVHGRGAGMIVTDDLVGGQKDARSDLMMQSAREFLLIDLKSRESDNWNIHLGMQTRWRIDDPHGAAVEAYPGEYQTLRYPALAESDDPLGRDEGDALWPAKRSRKRLEAIRKGTPSHEWNAVYQQNPQPAVGSVWARHWWDGRTFTVDDSKEYVTTYDGLRYPLHDLHKYVVVDLAITEKSSADYTVIGCFAMLPERPSRAVLLDMRRERMEGPKINPAVRSMLGKWKAGIAYYEKAAQQTMAAQYARGDGIPVRHVGRDKDVDVRVSGDKVAVSQDATPFVANGRLLVPEHAPWLGDLEAELLSFPRGPHDDMVDVLAWGCHIAMKTDLWSSLALAGANGPDREAASSGSRYGPDHPANPDRWDLEDEAIPARGGFQW